MPTPQTNVEWQEFWDAVWRDARLNSRSEFRSLVSQFPTWKGRQILAILNFCMEDIMARGKSNAEQTQANNRFQQTDFIDIPIVEADWQDIQKMYGSADVLVDAVSDVLEAGYRVGLSFNAQNDAFICSLTCRDSKSPNNGKTFNSFAETWFEALQICMYKHYVKAKKNWVSSDAKSTRPRFG